MSAYVAQRYPSSVQLLTDGACYGPDHVLTAIVSKVWSSARLPIAITGRGRLKIVEFVAAQIIDAAERAQSIDDLMDGVPRIFEDLRACDPPHFDVAIAAWSETNGASLWYFDSGGEFGSPNHAPWELHAVPHSWCASELTGKEMVDLRYRNGPHQQPGRFMWVDPSYLKDYGADVMELIRSKPTGDHFSVGGHCQLTTVTADGVETVTLRTWPEDKIGQKLNPPPMDLSPSKVMNRHERRALARRAA
ncbi:MAG: hypothetical protein EOQ28_04185 [Mesorhizobium sp.]|uniref:hypothetical protein n=1 Tax=Mesorhizobium sp. TaxID=1871066 RepID=UPI000FE47DC9|nr:hypothetical protein [Mesorhizobium sp.]RWA76889.1 MAG: hypothetical protein EOQ28_04185 [Mesorhizobium sp.]